MKASLILIFSALLLGSGCQSETDEVLLLDCLLATFIDNFPSDSSDVIIIGEVQVCADTSTTLMISFYARKYLYQEFDCVQAEFNGRTILYTSEALSAYTNSENQVFDEAHRVKTSLAWERFNTTDLPSERDFMMPTYNPTSVHVIIDNRRKGGDDFFFDGALFKERCGLCEE